MVISSRFSSLGNGVNSGAREPYEMALKDKNVSEGTVTTVGEVSAMTDKTHTKETIKQPTTPIPKALDLTIRLPSLRFYAREGLGSKTFSDLATGYPQCFPPAFLRKQEWGLGTL